MSGRAFSSDLNQGADRTSPHLPGSLPSATRAPKRRRARLAFLLLMVFLPVLIVVSIVVGIRVGQSRGGTAPVSTSAASPTADPALYQRITSQHPSFVDSLQDATSSTWFEAHKPTYGCEIKPDGLHVHIQETNRVAYCTTKLGEFGDFALQVEMQMRSGSGGIIFRSDIQAGNLYYFQADPNGSYSISIQQNHTYTELSQGTSSAYASDAGQKNVLTIIAQKNHLSFYVNQTWLTTIVDSTYAVGDIGLIARNSGASAEVIYTNARIWML